MDGCDVWDGWKVLKLGEGGTPKVGGLYAGFLIHYSTRPIVLNSFDKSPRPRFFSDKIHDTYIPAPILGAVAGLICYPLLMGSVLEFSTLAP